MGGQQSKLVAGVALALLLLKRDRVVPFLLHDKKRLAFLLAVCYAFCRVDFKQESTSSPKAGSGDICNCVACPFENGPRKFGYGARNKCTICNTQQPPVPLESSIKKRRNRGVRVRGKRILDDITSTCNMLRVWGKRIIDYITSNKCANCLEIVPVNEMVMMSCCRQQRCQTCWTRWIQTRIEVWQNERTSPRPSFPCLHCRQFNVATQRFLNDQFGVNMESFQRLRPDIRLCPQCQRAIQRSAGCDTMTCGRNTDYRVGNNQLGGCGHQFSWQQAQRAAF